MPLPHEALAMQTPAEMYAASPRPYRGLPDLTYPLHVRSPSWHLRTDKVFLRDVGRCNLAERIEPPC